MILPKNHPYLPWADIWQGAWAPRDSITKLEEAFARACGSNFALALPYNRVGIYLALKVFGISKQEVLMPAYTCAVVVNSVVCSGNVPVFVDIDPITYNMDMPKLLEAMTPKTGAVIVTSMYGTPMDSGGLRKRLPQNVRLIDDAALVLPGFEYESPIGESSDVALLSLDLNKMLTSVNGGIALFSDEATFKTFKNQRDALLTKASWVKKLEILAAAVLFQLVFPPHVYGLLDKARKSSPFLRQKTDAYSNDEIKMYGDWKTHFSATQAAIGLRQLAHSDKIGAARGRNDRIYLELLGDFPQLGLPKRVDHPYSHFTVRVPRRDQTCFREKMYQFGVECGRTLDYCLPEMETYRSWASNGTWPEASKAAQEIVNLPNYPAMDEARIGYVVNCVRKTLG